MKKFIVITVLFLFLIAPLTIATPALAAFTANGDITVTGVTGAGTVDMTIRNLSASASWEFSGGVFTVINPTNSTFTVSCGNSAAKAIKATLSGNTVACVKNSSLGTSYVTLPSGAGTYTIAPTTTNLSNSITYNSACGAATCDSGYSVSGSGSSATCIANSGGGGGSASITYCSSVEYDEWQTTCVNNLQYRNILSRSPSNCALTTAQENNRKKACGVVTPITETQEPETTTASTAGMPATDRYGNITLGQMLIDAKTIISGDVHQAIAEMGVSRDTASEANYSATIVEKIVAGSGITAQVRNTITNFVTYGTKATNALGAGERAGVVNSYKSAFGNLPTTEEGWNDVIKIANGRWPGTQSAKAEERAAVNFRTVYLREPDRSNANDDAAITVMAYGLRPADRNLNSEKAAIRIFKDIYGYNPEKATAWDVVRAIAYSGSIR